MSSFKQVGAIVHWGPESKASAGFWKIAEITPAPVGDLLLSEIAGGSQPIIENGKETGAFVHRIDDNETTYCVVDGDGNILTQTRAGEAYFRSAFDAFFEYRRNRQDAAALATVRLTNEVGATARGRLLDLHETDVATMTPPDKYGDSALWFSRDDERSVTTKDLLDYYARDYAPDASGMAWTREIGIDALKHAEHHGLLVAACDIHLKAFRHGEDDGFVTRASDLLARYGDNETTRYAIIDALYAEGSNDYAYIDVREGGMPSVLCFQSLRKVPVAIDPPKLAAPSRGLSLI
jgi:hypothetical protein